MAMQKVLTATIICLGLAVLWAVDRWQVTHWRSEKSLELDATLRLCHTRLENSILGRFKAVESLASLFALHPDTTPEEFSHFASLLLSFHHPIRAIQYADPDTRVIYVYPPRGNEITIQKPMMLLSDPDRRSFVQKAIRQKSATLQGPFELRQGGSGVVLRFPIFGGNRFLGLSIGVYDLPVLVSEALAGVNLDEFTISLASPAGEVFWSTGRPPAGRVQRSVTVADATWVLGADWSVYPSPPALPRFLIWLAGLGLLAVFLYSLRFHHKQEQQLETIVAKRTRELSDLNQALKASEDKYRSILENASVVIFIKDADGKYLYINKKFENLYGLARQKVQGLTDHEIFPPELARQFRDTDDRIIKHNQPMDVEEKIPLADGEHTVISTKFPLRDSGGRAYAICGISTDITERMKIESALGDREARFKAIFEHSPFAISLVTPDGTPIISNPAFCTIMGYSEDELKNFDFARLTHPEDLKREIPLLQELVDGERESYQLEKRNIHKDGHPIWLNVHIMAVRDDRRNIKYLVAIGEDITEKKRMETELLQKRKMEAIGNLAGGIAHDFNNVLTSIIGFTELALDEAKTGPVTREHLREVYAAGLRAKDLVWQILTFARKTEEKSSPIRIDTIAQEVLKLLRSSLPATIDMQGNIESDSLVMGNASQIHQVLLNLCTNAAHAMEKAGGRLNVKVRDIAVDPASAELVEGLTAGDHIEISVSDTGVGISPQIIDSVFEPYFTTKEPGEGTGMGLAMVHGIVAGLGGKVTVASRLGDGTVFTVYLPITRGGQKSSPSENEPIQHGSERILFVDDECQIARMGGQILSRLGYTVTVKTSSLEAVELFRSQPSRFDLVITDMTMPELTGDRLAKEILEIDPCIPIILCTGYSNRITAETAYQMGIKAFVYKPVVKAELAQTVRRVLDASND